MPAKRSIQSPNIQSFQASQTYTWKRVKTHFLKRKRHFCLLSFQSNEIHRQQWETLPGKMTTSPQQCPLSPCMFRDTSSPLGTQTWTPLEHTTGHTSNYGCFNAFHYNSFTSWMAYDQNTHWVLTAVIKIRPRDSWIDKQRRLKSTWFFSSRKAGEVVYTAHTHCKEPVLQFVQALARGVMSQLNSLKKGAEPGQLWFFLNVHPTHHFL